MLKEMLSKIVPSDGVVGMLKADHRKVEGLFQEFEQATDRRTKTRIVQEALKELDIHTALEEDIIYPAIRAKIDDEAIMDEAFEEHHVAHVLMEELKAMRPSDDRFEAKFKVLAESVKHHVKEEESQVLPKAKEMEVDSPELQERVAERKQELLSGRSGRRSTVRARTRTRSRGTARSKRRRAA
jgi:hemerythrin superfamily protein